MLLLMEEMIMMMDDGWMGDGFTKATKKKKISIFSL